MALRSRSRPAPPPPPVRRVALVEDCIFTPTPRQEQFLRDLFSGTYRILALGGAIRGTKTFASLWALVLLCRFFPGSRWAIVRKDLPTLRRTVIPSFEKLRPSAFIAPLNKGDWTYRCANGAEILLFPESLDTDPDLNRWRGLEVNGFLLEEANELAESSFEKAKERAGTWRIPPTPAQRARGARPAEPPPLVLLTFNPDDGYVRRVFYEPHRNGSLQPPYYFLPLTPKDNPYVTAEQWAIWRTMPPKIYARFIEGDWGAIMHPNQLIAFQWVHDALSTPQVPGELREALDVARSLEGEGDASVFARVRGNTLIRLDERHIAQLKELSDEALVRHRALHLNERAYRVDAVALGAGVADNLAAAGVSVYRFLGGSKKVIPRPLAHAPRPGAARLRGPLLPVDPAAPSAYKFADLRTQAWWEFAEGLRAGRVAIALEPDCDPMAFSKLVQDLTAPRWTVTGDLTIMLEPKERTKQRIGRSPDFGDACVMAFFEVPLGLPSGDLPLSTASYSIR